MKRVSMKLLQVTIISVFLIVHLLSGQPTLSDIPIVPPTGLNLLEHERMRREQQSMQKIENIVSRVVSQKSDLKKKKRFEKEKIKLACNHAGNAQTKQQEIVTPHLYKLLENFYRSPDLAKKKISLHFKKTDIKRALELIAKMGQITCVVDSDVTGYIDDIKLENMSVGASLQLLLSSNNPRLALLKLHDIWRVVRIPVAAEALSEQVSMLEDEEYAQEVVTLFHAKWDEHFKKRIENLWHGIVGSKSAKEGSYVMFDDATKKVFFRGQRQHVQDFTQCLHQLDQPIAQIKIDARVIIASKDFDENFGIQWSGVYNRRASVNHFDFIGLGPITSNDPNSPDYTASHNLFSNLIGWSLNFLPTGMFTKTGLNIPIVFGNKDMSTKRLNLMLNMAETRNEIKTILKPSLLVNSEESAEILVGEQLPQETRVDETIEGKLTNVTTTQYKDVGMKIKVKPVATPDQEAVFLDVYVENSSVVRQELAGIQTVNNGGLFTYTIETSRSKNRVLLKSGQTTLISGLIVKTQERMKTGIPYLQDIPVLGWFFKGSRKHLVDKQILIFLTPTIV